MRMAPLTSLLWYLRGSHKYADSHFSHYKTHQCLPIMLGMKSSLSSWSPRLSLPLQLHLLCSPLPHPTPATLISSLILEYCGPDSGPLHMLCPLPGTLLPLFIKFCSSFHSGLSSDNSSSGTFATPWSIPLSALF